MRSAFRIFLPALAAILTLAFSLSASAQTRARTPIRIPDVLGYRTLKCDLHIHTVFSDGSVWPDIRSEEAWREGLDAIAITDHIEYQPHKDDLPTHHNRSFQIAEPRGRDLQLLVIRGSEVTRKMPPGHLNAVFLQDSKSLDTPDWRDAVKEARRQGAFIFWNHPGWSGQQPDGVARWYPEHDEILGNDMLHGIEVINGRSYYPEAHRWCLEKNLTMLSNSDIHNPLNLDYHVHAGDHRPVTLVFAREATTASIKEALLDRRTAAYSGNRIIGREPFLQAIFTESIRIKNPDIRIKAKQRVYVQIHNDADISYELELAGAAPDLVLPRELTLPAGRTALLEVRGASETITAQREIKIPFRVLNLLVAPNEGLKTELALKVELLPK